MEAFWLGVVATLVVSAIIGACKMWVLPRIAHSMSKEPNLSGHWYTHDSAGGPRVGEADITQVATKVRIKVHRHTSRNGRQIDRTFAYRGAVSSGVMVAVFQDTKTRYHGGAIVLQFDQNTACLTGLTVYRDNAQVMANDFVLSRQ